MKTIAEKLISQIEWDSYTEIAGPALHIGAALLELLSSNDAASAETAYWKIENHVVVQGSLFSSAAPVTRVLVAALIDSPPPYIRISILDLLYQILSGWSPEENDRLVQECRRFAIEGFWLLVREYVYGPRDAAMDVLEILDTDFDFKSLVSVE